MVVVVIVAVVDARVFVESVLAVVGVNGVVFEGVAVVVGVISDVVDSLLVVIAMNGVVFGNVVLTEVSVGVVIAGRVEESVVVIVIAVLGGTVVEDTGVLAVVVIAVVVVGLVALVTVRQAGFGKLLVFVHGIVQ